MAVNLADIYGGPLEDGSSIFTHLEEGLVKSPNGPAVVVMHQQADHLSEITGGTSAVDGTNARGCLTWTYTQLHHAALRLSAGLQAHGIRPGIRVATFMPNQVEYPLLLWTCSLLRLTLCSLDPGATNTPRRAELESFMSRLSPDVILALDASAADAIDVTTVKLGIKSPLVKIILDDDAPATWTTIVQLAASADPSTEEVNTLLQDARNDDPSRIASILFTSGTSSGKPKGCPRSVASATHVLLSQHWGEKILDTNSRLGAFSANFRAISPTLHMAAFKAGASAVMADPAEGMKGVIRAIREQNITYLLFVPALLHAYLAELKCTRVDLDVSRIKTVMLGGDMATRDILLKAAEAFPYAKVAVAHGMTEGGGFFSWPYYQISLDDIPYFGEICPLGTVVKGVHIRIRDPEIGKTLLRGEPGELLINCKSVIKNYLNNTNSEAFLRGEDNKQWFRTGDLATIDDSGIVYILGRLKDVIKRAGIPITPAALESCIAVYTNSTTSVLAWPHQTLGEVPLAVVESLNGRTEEDVKEQVLETFGKDYALEDVLTLAQLGMARWPLNATGKIMKLELAPKIPQYLGEKA